jgi:hypothetical protein
LSVWSSWNYYLLDALWDAFGEVARLAYGQSIARLQQASGAASLTLLKIMVDTNAPVPAE